MSDPPITRLRSKVRIEYLISAGTAQTTFLDGIAEGRILGTQFDDTGRVYVPARGLCPTTGSLPSATVELPSTGTVTTFCVINIPFEGQRLPPPYVCAAILLDGADLPLFHIVAGIEPAAVRMGLRVRAAWVEPWERAPTLESIKFFEPTGEPDAPFAAYAEHL